MIDRPAGATRVGDTGHAYVWRGPASLRGVLSGCNSEGSRGAWHTDAAAGLEDVEESAGAGAGLRRSMADGTSGSRDTMRWPICKGAGAGTRWLRGVPGLCEDANAGHLVENDIRAFPPLRNWRKGRGRHQVDSARRARPAWRRSAVTAWEEPCRYWNIEMDDDNEEALTPKGQ